MSIPWVRIFNLSLRIHDNLCLSNNLLVNLTKASKLEKERESKSKSGTRSQRLIHLLDKILVLRTSLVER